MFTQINDTDLNATNGGVTPKRNIARRQIVNQLNQPFSAIPHNPGRIRTIDITSPSGNIRNHAFFDNRPVPTSTRKKVVAGAVAGIIIAASGTAAILKSEDII